jgi:hypothetical protein
MMNDELAPQAPAGNRQLKASIASALSTGAQHPHLLSLFDVQITKMKIFLSIAFYGVFTPFLPRLLAFADFK